jgi:hypothetical protein
MNQFNWLALDDILQQQDASTLDKEENIEQ